MKGPVVCMDRRGVRKFLIAAGDGVGCEMLATDSFVAT